MTQTLLNRAAWQMAVGKPLHVEAADLTQPRDGEILVRNKAVAINPLDWLLQGEALLPWLVYPTILGSDTAGEVAALGSGVTRFKIGDRVLGQAVSTTTNNPAEGTFQLYTIVAEHMASPIPDDMAYADAAVIPLGLGTAAVGLYQRAHLGLSQPSLAPVAKDEVVLVWGASSSVGCNAIQLAAASGYTCIATASAQNSDMLKRLGASEVFDYSNLDVVDQVIRALRGRRLAGVIHATGNVDNSLAVAAASEGTGKVAVTLRPPETVPNGVTVTHIIGPSLKDDEVGPMIYRDFLPHALHAGSFVPAPPANIVGYGLDALQVAMETLKAGVSAAKLVVTLD